MMQPAPVELEIRSRERQVRITWDDDHVTVYPMRYLRGYCPCAKCQGHGGAWRFVAVESPAVARVEEVGNYALRIVWNDGGDDSVQHTTGIYSFENLRELCPCDACRGAAGSSHPFDRMG